MKEGERQTPIPSAKPAFVCACYEAMRSACKKLPSYKEHEGEGYCVLHYPGKEKSTDFAERASCTSEGLVG
jgi:hypothetical protein